LIFEPLAAFEFGDVVDSRRADVLQCFAREKSLVAGDDYVWKSQQPREDIVRND
jgi:hypothetical protein